MSLVKISLAIGASLLGLHVYIMNSRKKVCRQGVKMVQAEIEGKKVEFAVFDTRRADWNPEEEVIIFETGGAMPASSWGYIQSKVPPSIAYDRLGYGFFSSKPFYPRDCKHLALELDALLKALGIKQVKLVGHSMGGVVVRTYTALDTTVNVDGLVLVEASHPHVLEHVKPLANQFAHPNLFRSLFYILSPLSWFGILDWIPRAPLYSDFVAERFTQAGLNINRVYWDTIAPQNMLYSLLTLAEFPGSLKYLQSLSLPDLKDKTVVVYAGKAAPGMTQETLDICHDLQKDTPAREYVVDDQVDHVEICVSDKLVKVLNGK